MDYYDFYKLAGEARMSDHQVRKAYREPSKVRAGTLTRLTAAAKKLGLQPPATNPAERVVHMVLENVVCDAVNGKAGRVGFTAVDGKRVILEGEAVQLAEWFSGVGRKYKLTIEAVP